MTNAERAAHYQRLALAAAVNPPTHAAALTPLAAVLDAAATYAAPWASPEAQRVARQTCVDQIDAALDRCGPDGASNLVFELAFRLALRDQL